MEKERQTDEDTETYRASDVLTTICHLAIEMSVWLLFYIYIGNTQISILLLCFLYLFVELMIMLND